ncbi:MAG: hypothetical protein ACOC9O_04305 [Myxococcota bacterium]
MTVAVPAGLHPDRRRICEVAIGEIGTGEVPHASNRGPVERYFPRWQVRDLEEKDARAGRQVRGPAWCAYFVAWCWSQALEHHPLDAPVASVDEMSLRAWARGLWIDLRDPGDLVMGPAPGDAFVMLDGLFDQLRNDQGHTGLILRVSRDGHEWITVEGNTGHAVRLGRRRVDEPKMRGVISVLGDIGTEGWEVGLGDVETADVGALGTR